MRSAQEPRDDFRSSSAVHPDASVRLAWFLGRLLDDTIRVPGTDFRVGLDPVIGLVPGLGDAVTALAASAIPLLGARLGVPRIVLVRMCLNLFLNAAIGGIPGLGDLFSFWYKSNLRNAALLERHASGDQRTAGDWFFVIGLLTGVFLAIVAVLAGVIWLAAQIWKAVS
jgi:hypothetical protein